MSAPAAYVLAQAPADCDVADLVRPVMVLPTDDPATVIWPCPRCWDENGRIAMYAHVAGGMCFKCSGMGGAPMGTAAAERKAEKLIKGRITRARKAERDRLAKQAARKATQAALIEAHPVLAVLADETVTGGWRPAEPGEDVHDRYWDGTQEIGVVTVKPLGDAVYHMAMDFRVFPERFNDKRAAAAAAAIERIQAQRAEKAAKIAAAGAIPSGRVTITGTVIAAWSTEQQAGPYGTDWVTKIRVETPEGWVAVGTVPGAILEQLAAQGATGRAAERVKGRAVEFVARVEEARTQKEGELPVGFYSRPTRARLV